jgi:hypothetical protein
MLEPTGMDRLKPKRWAHIGWLCGSRLGSGDADWLRDITTGGLGAEQDCSVPLNCLLHSKVNLLLKGLLIFPGCYRESTNLPLVAVEAAYVESPGLTVGIIFLAIYNLGNSKAADNIRWERIVFSFHWYLDITQGMIC